MFAKILSVGALALAPVPVVPIYIDYPLVEQVRCLEGTGTAFTAGGKIISVNHVTELTGCSINGVPLNAKREGDKDFSTAPSEIQGYKIDCGGFEKDEVVYASGYARGGPERLITLVATGEYHPNGMAALWGYPTVIPGMSGGPIFNSRGEVVGVVNMYALFYPLSFSVELKNTAVCSGRVG